MSKATYVRDTDGNIPHCAGSYEIERHGYVECAQVFTAQMVYDGYLHTRSSVLIKLEFAGGTKKCLMRMEELDRLILAKANPMRMLGTWSITKHGAYQTVRFLS